MDKTCKWERVGFSFYPHCYRERDNQMTDGFARMFRYCPHCGGRIVTSGPIDKSEADKIQMTIDRIAALQAQLADERDNNVLHAEARAREVSAFEATISRITSDIVDERSKFDRLREALKPFSDIGKKIPDNWNGKYPLKNQQVTGVGFHLPTVNDYRNAAEALSATEPKEPS